MRISRHEHQKIIRLYSSGLTLEEIGGRYGVSRERIRQIVKSHGVEMKKLRARGGQSKSKKPVSETDRAIASAYASGKYPSQIIDELGVTLDQIESTIRRLNLKRHGHDGRFDTVERRETDAKIVEAYLSGLSQPKIMATLGLNAPSRIYRALQRAGINPMRGELYSRFGRSAYIRDADTFCS